MNAIVDRFRLYIDGLDGVVDGMLDRADDPDDVYARLGEWWQDLQLVGTFVGVDRMKVWRALSVDMQTGAITDVIEFDGLGVYWTYRKGDATPYSGQRGLDIVVLEAEVGVDDIDFVDTLELQLDSGIDEREIRLKNSVDVKLTAVFWRTGPDRYKRLRNTPKRGVAGR